MYEPTTITDLLKRLWGQPVVLFVVAVTGLLLLGGVASPTIFAAGSGRKVTSSAVGPIKRPTSPVPVSAPASSVPAPAAQAATTAPGPVPSPQARTRLIAFYANFDDAGLASLESNAQHIDVLMPMWYSLGANGRLGFDSSHAARVTSIIKSKNPGMKVMPIIDDAPGISAVLADPARRDAAALHIVRTIQKAGYAGINIDFENIVEGDRDNLSAFMATLYRLAREAKLEVSIDINALSKRYDASSLGKNADYVIPMLYDQHWKTSPPGAIAEIRWFEETLNRLLASVPAEKVIVGMGTYGYDWGPGGSRAVSRTYAAATAISKQNNAPMRFGGPALSSSFAYGGRTVWLQDAMTAFAQLRVASKYGVNGYAFWRLGAEDPDLWKVLPKRDTLDRAVAESLNRPGRSVYYDEGRGLITQGTTGP